MTGRLLRALLADSESAPVATVATLATLRPKVAEVAKVASLAHSENAPLLSELLAAAMRACDYWGDSEDAREQMRRDCRAAPREDWDALRQHFMRNYPKGALHD